jgi:hypothetical protein
MANKFWVTEPSGDTSMGTTKKTRTDTATAWEQDLVAQLKDCREEKIGTCGRRIQELAGPLVDQAGSEDRQHKSESAQN